MNLTRISAAKLSAELTKAGWSPRYDSDGDVIMRMRSIEPPHADAAFYRIDQDYVMRGHLLGATVTQLPDGKTMWTVPDDSPYEPTAIVQKVSTVYLMPRPGGVQIQIHAAVQPISDTRPMHIKVTADAQRKAELERDYPNFGVVTDGRLTWLSTTAVARRASTSDLMTLIRTCWQAGLDMIGTDFTGVLVGRRID